jgi:hypothetical protein
MEGRVGEREVREIIIRDIFYVFLYADSYHLSRHQQYRLPTLLKKKKALSLFYRIAP